MKKILPVALFVIGLAVFAGLYFFVIKGNKAEKEPLVEEEETVAEIPLDQRPFTSLTPTSDGHWLNLKIENIKVSAASLDYELLYKVGDGRTQGVPGTIKLSGDQMIERKLLLGSESSGKFRYDEGVEEGTLTLRFRNDKGKLTGKLSTNFRLQSADLELSSSDGKFTYSLSKSPKGVFFVTMETFGLPKEASVSVKSGPYGIFASDSKEYPGEVNLEGSVQYWDGSSWTSITGSSDNIGVFISS